MNAIYEAADMLRRNADKLVALAPELNFPESEYTLKQAVAKIAGVVPGYSTLGMNITISGDGAKAEVVWTVWDGTTYFRAETMAGAINSCLAAHAKSFPQDPLDAAQAVLNGAVPIPY